MAPSQAATAKPSAASEWVEAALAFLFPPVCGICQQQRASAAEGYVCPSCTQRVRWVVPPFCDRCGLPFDGALQQPFVCANCQEVDLGFEFARAAVVANELILEVVHRYKYQRAVWFEPFLGQLLTQAAAGQIQPREWDMIVPVPLHAVKLREREFNQAERLARHLGRLTGIPVQTGWVRRATPTDTQTRLSRAARAENVARAFAPAGNSGLDGRSCLVFDDVLTTGATASAVARVLRGMGASRVAVWSVARATF